MNGPDGLRRRDGPHGGPVVGDGHAAAVDVDVSVPLVGGAVAGVQFLGQETAWHDEKRSVLTSSGIVCFSSHSNNLGRNIFFWSNIRYNFISHSRYCVCVIAVVWFEYFLLTILVILQSI